MNKISGILTITLNFAGQHSDGQNIIFTDGEYINQIAACKDVSLVLLLKPISIQYYSNTLHLF